MAIETFYYDAQIKKYIVQFMHIFNNMHVKMGKRDAEDEILVRVPIQYGNKDRVVAHIQGGNTQNKPLRLPVMSANLSSIMLAPDLRKGVGQERKFTHLPQGGVFPDDIETISQLMPVPYRVQMELAIYVSNTEQRFQILEQIMMLFDPILQIQTSDKAFDWTMITSVELDAIGLDNNYPIATDRRIDITTLGFNYPIYISAPANAKNSYVKDIFVRMGVVGDTDDMLGELDGQGLTYDHIIDGGDATI